MILHIKISKGVHEMLLEPINSFSKAGYKNLLSFKLSLIVKNEIKEKYSIHISIKHNKILRNKFF